MVFEKYGLKLPRILLPREDVDMTRWAVLSCDQYTSQPSYWEKAAAIVGSAPSTLHMIQPEVYLDQAGERVEYVLEHMRRYLLEGILQELEEGFLYVERRTLAHPCRRGLMAAIDLEQYTYGENSHGLIRATEGVVMARIPPRLAIRSKAPLELPHVMLLVNDPQDLLLGKLAQRKNTLPKLYDFPLMLGGGSVAGYQVTDQAALAGVEQALAQLLEQAALQDAEHPMLIAVGDGNHSLVTAKSHWDALKATLSEAEKVGHPARYALCELVNLFDPGLDFEPIHRVVFGIDPEGLLDAIREWAAAHQASPGYTQSVVYQYGSVKGSLELGSMPTPLQEASLQDCFGELLPSFPGASIDYIHGDDAVAELVSKGDALGLLMPAFDKSSLFTYVAAHGSLPRKTFSMGHADEKRFYLECRKITREVPSFS